MDKKRWAALVAAGVIGGRTYHLVNESAQQNQVAAQEAAKAVLRNQYVLNPILSVQTPTLIDEVDSLTGFTRAKIAPDTGLVALELTAAESDKNKSKIFVVANNQDQVITPKGGVNEIDILMPVSIPGVQPNTGFGHKVINDAGRNAATRNSLNLDTKIFLEYPGALAQRDGEDLVIRFLKKDEVPNDKTPTITVRGQFAENRYITDNNGNIEEIKNSTVAGFGIIGEDGTVRSLGFNKNQNSNGALQSVGQWNRVIKEGIEMTIAEREAVILNAEQTARTGVMDSIIAKSSARTSDSLSANATPVSAYVSPEQQFTAIENSIKTLSERIKISRMPPDTSEKPVLTADEMALQADLNTQKQMFAEYLKAQSHKITSLAGKAFNGLVQSIITSPNLCEDGTGKRDFCDSVATRTGGPSGQSR